jgi:hypothetical protein
MPLPCITPVKGEGFILNMAHMGSLCVISKHLNQNFETTTDGDYIHRIFKDYNDITIFDDSDKICVMELSDPTRYIKNVIHRLPLSDIQVAEYLQKTASWEKYSMQNFRRPLRYYWCTPTPELWRKKEQENSIQVESILNRSQIYSWVHVLEADENYIKFGKLLHHLVCDNALFKGLGSHQKRVFVVPDIEDLFCFLSRYNEAKNADMLNYETLILSLIFKYDWQNDQNGDSICYSAVGDKVSLSYDIVENRRKLIAVNGIKVRKHTLLEDSIVCFLYSGWHFSESIVKTSDKVSITGIQQKVERATSEQTALVIGAIAKTVSGLAAGSTFTHAIERVNKELFRDMNCFRILKKIYGNDWQGFVLPWVNALEPYFHKWPEPSKWLEEGNDFGFKDNRVKRILNFFRKRSVASSIGFVQFFNKNCAFDDMLPYPKHINRNTTASDLSELFGITVVTNSRKDNYLQRGKYTLKNMLCMNWKNEWVKSIDYLLYYVFKSLSEKHSDLAKNSEIYYKLGLILEKAFLLVEAHLCFAACAFLSPGFKDTVEHRSAVEMKIFGLEI